MVVIGGMEVELICALINDNQRMQEKCDEFGRDLLSIIEEEAERDVVEAVLDEVSREYLSIAKRAVEILARCILEVLDEPVFQKLYSPEWEGEEAPITTLTVTLQDYFADLQDWLSEYHFAKLLKEMLHTVTIYYIMSLRRKVALCTRPNEPFTFTNELLAAKKIIQERLQLQDFFDKFLPLLRHGGVKSKDALSEELEGLQSLTKIVTCRHFSSAEHDCKLLFGRYGVDGLRLAQVGFLCNPSIPRNDRQNNVDAAKRLFDANSAASSYNAQPMEDFAAFDIALQALQAGVQAGNKTKGFWSRLRSNGINK
jgi:hypothetical protein